MDNKKSIKKKYITLLILALLLVLPGFLYFIIRVQSKNNYKILPVYGQKSLTGTSHTKMGRVIPDTLYHTIPQFSFYNQLNKKVDNAIWDKKVVILSLFSSNSNNVNSTTSLDALKKLFDKYGKNKILTFSSIDVSPYSSKESLSNTYKLYASNSPNWHFLATDTLSVYSFVRKGLLLDVLLDNDNLLFSHKIVLIDTKHRIRGFYDVNRPEEMDRLDDEILVLTTEEVRNIKDGR